MRTIENTEAYWCGHCDGHTSNFHTVEKNGKDAIICCDCGSLLAIKPQVKA